MMRSPQLEDCLQSPHLWFDKSASSLSSADMENAGQHLKAAKEQKEPIEQWNSAYKSMYNSSLALLHSIRYRVSGFRCLVTALADYFVKKGMLDRAHVENMVRAQKFEGKPDENVAAAEAFFAAAKQILKL